MIHLIAIKTGPRKWVVTTSDMREKYVCEIPQVPMPKILQELQAIENWLEDVGFKDQNKSSERCN